MVMILVVSFMTVMLVFVAFARLFVAFARLLVAFARLLVAFTTTISSFEAAFFVLFLLGQLVLNVGQFAVEVKWIVPEVTVLNVASESVAWLMV